MKTFTCRNFEGVYLRGVAVVRAKDKVEASSILNAALREQGLPGKTEPKDFIEFPLGPGDNCRILDDGDY